MKIGVVADTHSRDIPKKLLDDFKSVDLIVHAGDFCTEKDYQTFEKMNMVKAVYGNMDEPKIRKKLPEKLTFEFGGVRFGLLHGEGAPKNILDFIRSQFKKGEVDAVIFGHSHSPINKIVDGVLYFNPGSPNDTIYASCQSYGILEVKSGKVSGKIIEIEG